MRWLLVLFSEWGLVFLKRQSRLCVDLAFVVVLGITCLVVVLGITCLGSVPGQTQSFSDPKCLTKSPIPLEECYEEFVAPETTVRAEPPQGSACSVRVRN